MARIIAIDDEKSVLDMIERALEDAGNDVRTFTSPEEAIAALRNFNPEVVLSDIRMDIMNGFDVLREIKQKKPEINVILITAYASVDTAVEAIRNGAFDYLIKPFKIEELRVAVQRALSEKKITPEARNAFFQRKEIIGKSDTIDHVRDLIDKVSKTETTILVIGESGTGKELVAREVHALSDRSHLPFVSINCAALPDSLLESELFGHEKGSFTGAINTKIGLMEYAHGGTLFLDEIGEVSAAIQVKLLRALQEKEIKRIGGLQDISVDVRIIAATSRNLEDEVRAGSFREDLYYRLNVIPIIIPPLRERIVDIPLLAEHFVEVLSKSMNREVCFEASAIEYLMRLDWPGNVRELENTIERVLALCDEPFITGENLQDILNDKNIVRGQQTFSSKLKKETEHVEKEIIMRALKETGGNKLRAAQRLNISRQNLQYKLKKYNLL